MARPSPRALVAVALGVVGGWLVAEAALQAAAFVVWRTHRSRPPATEPAGRVVLCVGDSFTFGLGASRHDRNYPSRLASALQSADPGSWRVVNEGRPGRNSAQLEAALPALLRRHRPEVVLILVGVNDWWNDEVDTRRGGKEAPADAGSGWTWTWRTKRLLALAVHAWRRRGDAAPATARTAPAGPPVAAAPVSTPATLEELEARVAAGGRGRQPRAAVVALRPAVQAAGDSARTMRLLRVASRLEMDAIVLEDGERLAREKGPSAELCRLLTKPTLYGPQPQRALEWAREAVRLDPNDVSGHRTLLMMEWGTGDVRGAARELLLAYHLDSDSTALAAHFSGYNFAKALDRSAFDSLAAACLPDPAERALTLRAYDRSRDAGALEAALTDRLDGIVRIVEDAGARPVLFTYPHVGAQEPEKVNRCVRDVAARRRVPLVDLRGVFEERSRQVPLADLFAPDGHCADLGYQLMADEAARLLLGKGDRERAPAPGGMPDARN
jgi:lysophospholipase L1-like esterase